MSPSDAFDSEPPASDADERNPHGTNVQGEELHSGELQSDDSSNANAIRKPQNSQSYLLQYSARAMACEFEVFVPATANRDEEADAAEPPALQALQLVEQLERQLSVFQTTSELSRINQLAAEEPVGVEPRLFALLQECQRLWRATGGAFDITSTPLTRVWGFFRRQGKVPDSDALAEAQQSVGFENVVLDVETRTVKFKQPGIELNLGGIGKGYALDRCGELLRDLDSPCYLWHAGQSSVLAGGDQPGKPDGAGWPIEVGNPLKPGKPLGTLLVKSAGVGSSGSGQQFFRHQGKRYGHIIDPRDGQPAGHVLFVSVLAPTAAVADALSTAFYILGPTQTAAYCKRNPGTGCVMLAANTIDGPMNLHVLGVAEDQFLPA